MHLSRTQGGNFRLLREFDLNPDPGLNLILGPNAAGKTTFLEAVYTLGRGRSFRGTPAELAGEQGANWWLNGRVAMEGAAESSLGVAWSPDGLETRIDQANATALDLVKRLPLQILEPDSHRLLEDGPSHRRRYLDWGVFHVEQPFYPAWRRYERALRQRNRALKARAERGEIEAWNPELEEAGETMQATRQRFLDALRPQLAREVQTLLGDAEWSLELLPGWPEGKTLGEALRESHAQDCRLGITACGPHRAELQLNFAGRSAKHQVSRGQQKLLIAALLIAQARLIAGGTACPPVLLVDDFPAELGPGFQEALLGALEAYAGQVFVTSIERTPALERIPEPAVFHVEHGVFRRP